jgi:hypothetical protein
MKKALYILGIMALVVITMCKKPYSPKVIDAAGSYLVVEGLINSGTDSTIIRLSRTTKIYIQNANNATANPEAKAIVTVEDDQNASYTLKETTNGNYVAAALNLNTGRNYRLRIKTADGLVYLSDYEPVKVSPPIDSVGFKIDRTGLLIYANAHDATNNTRYYRWEYEEAWMFQVAYDSKYTGACDVIAPSSPINIPVNRVGSLYTCFTNDKSTSIILGSTAKLAQDVLYQAPIATIPASSEKISIRYSILVKQYALSKAGYEFWTNVQKKHRKSGKYFRCTAIGSHKQYTLYNRCRAAGYWLC